MHLSGKQVSKHSIKSIFYDAQFSNNDHSSSKKILTDIYKKSNIDYFLPEFLKCVKICLMHEEKSLNVERTLDFAAEFAVSFSSDLKEDETCPLLEGIFQFIFENHDCHIQLVRLRICQLMNRLLDNMGHDATVVEETYNKIAESMLVRLQDSMSSVRTQAVYALHRLQSPNDAKCDIIQAFVYHMTHDPCHDVRRAVIQKIAVNKMTLASILTRVHDIKDSVRKEAYIIISKFLIRQFTIKQRQLILESGLGDRSEVARDYVLDVLVPNWLKYFNNNYYDFLECIHVEKIPDTGLKLLKAIFGKQRDVILESRVKEMCIFNQRISYDKLDIITVIYWRALAEYVKPTDDDDKFEHIFEQVVPDLTPFCKYIRDYFFPTDTANQLASSNDESSTGNQQDDHESQNKNRSPNQSQNPSTSSNENHNESNTSPSKDSKTVDSKESQSNKMNCSKGPYVPDEAVLVHLLEMCKVYDLADEMGRTSLRQLCVDLLQSSAITLQSVAVLTTLLDHSVPDISSKLSIMAEVITELREPLQADNSVYVPDLLLLEAEEKKVELGEKLIELETEMEIAQELGDDARVEEIKVLMSTLKNELKIMNAVTPHEPGRNMNNDPDTLKKCLTIVVEIMKKGKILKMNPTLYSLMQNFIIPTLNHKIEGDGATAIKNLALQALGIFCVLDGELAKEHFMMFCFNIANETLSVTALKCVFDLLQVYGLSTFNIEQPDEVNNGEVSEEEGGRKPNLIILLMSLLTSESAEMRKTAVLGLCRLLFSGRIKSSDLVSKLILLWYNPLVECDPHVRQPLGVFFQMFGSSCAHAPTLLQKAFLPTIKEFFKMEVTNPMMEVEVESVANLMIELTRADFNSKGSKNTSSHNQIAINICEEVLSEELEHPNCIVLLKVLNHLELNFDITTDIAILSALTSRMVKTVSKEDKILARLALKFETMLRMRQDSNKTLSTVNNTLPADTSTKSSIKSHFLLTVRDDSGSESEAEPEEEEDLSQEEVTASRIMDDTEDTVIPGTPDSSDSESDEAFKGFTLFRGFNPPEEGAGVSQDLNFKRPSTLSEPTPAKTPFKVPGRTPRKAAKTPAPKSSSVSSDTIITPSKTSALPLITRSRETPAKTPARTPGKVSRTSSRSSAKNKKEKESIQLTPEKTSPEVVISTDRVTRSSRKRKS